jgi:hypothetical protein
MLGSSQRYEGCSKISRAAFLTKSTKVTAISNIWHHLLTPPLQSQSASVPLWCCMSYKHIFLLNLTYSMSNNSFYHTLCYSFLPLEIWKIQLLSLFVQLRITALRLTVQTWLDVPTSTTRRLHMCHHARAPSSGRWNCGWEMSSNFAEMMTSTPFRDLLHAVKLRHGTDGFTSPLKESMPRIFLP